MQRYLVGGAVRDELLGLPVIDRDWVVVGASPQDMLDAGYLLRDATFHTYLHPDTGEEHTLARRELKSGDGHRGFSIEVGPHVTLAEDLARRDLTVNAIARDCGGAHYAPHGGLQDIDSRQLRHVTGAFIDDPLRAWRAARFTALLAPLGFTLHPSTRTLLETMCRRTEFNELSAARVWAETERALQTGRPSAFIQTLAGTGALGDELGRATLDCLRVRRAGAELLDETERPTGARLGALATALGGDQGEDLLTRLGVPDALRMQLRVAGDVLGVVRRTATTGADVQGLLQRHDALRRWQHFDDALALALGMDGGGAAARIERLRQTLHAARQVRLQPQQRTGLQGAAIGARLAAERLRCIQRIWDAADASSGNPA